MNELSIKVNIADRTYPLTVKPEEEEKVRKAAKLVNDQLKAFGHQFSVRDKQDIISMCALELATALVSIQERSQAEDRDLSAQLRTISGLLKDVQL